jgi:hypothetical protein
MFLVGGVFISDLAELLIKGVNTPEIFQFEMLPVLITIVAIIILNIIF